ncbi:MAG: response regulator [Polyangiaceae bacterium]
MNQSSHERAESVEARHIVIAEDDIGLRNALERHLRSMGHEVTALGNAFELAGVLSSGTSADLLLLDLRLGDANALDVVERHPPPDGSTWTMILMSGRLRPRDVTRATRLGVGRILEKPLDLAELEDALRFAWDAADSVRGSVHGLSLLDLLQAFHLARRNVGLAVSGVPPGSLVLVQGELVAARCGDLEGNDALDELLQRVNASVQTFQLPDAIEPTFEGTPFDMLLLDALRRIDEAARPPSMPPQRVDEVLSAVERGRGTVSRPSIPVPSLSSHPTEPAPESLQDMLSEELEDGLVLQSIAQTLVDQALGRAERQPPFVRWIQGEPEDGSATALFASRMLPTLASDLEAWPASGWLAFVCPNGKSELGLAVFGHVPWLSIASFTGPFGRQRFYSAVVAMALAARHNAPRRSRTESRPTLGWPPGGENAEAAVCEACSDLLTNNPSVAACAVFTQPEGGGSSKMRGHASRGSSGEILWDQRWVLARRLLSTYGDGGETEIFLGQVDGSTLMGTTFGPHLVLACSHPEHQLGAFRSGVRKYLPRIRQTLG